MVVAGKKCKYGYEHIQLNLATKITIKMNRNNYILTYTNPGRTKEMYLVFITVRIDHEFHGNFLAERETSNNKSCVSQIKITWVEQSYLPWMIIPTCVVMYVERHILLFKEVLSFVFIYRMVINIKVKSD